MKRRHNPLDDTFNYEIPNTKRYARRPLTQNTLPFKLHLLNHWELVEEAARYISLDSRIEETTLSDRTNPQLAMVVYSPNCYQKYIDQIALLSRYSILPQTAMDIQSAEWITS